MNQQREDINTIADAAAGMAVRGEVSWEVLGCTERSAGYFEKLSDRREPELVIARCIV